MRTDRYRISARRRHAVVRAHTLLCTPFRMYKQYPTCPCSTDYHNVKLHHCATELEASHKCRHRSEMCVGSHARAHECRKTSGFVRYLVVRAVDSLISAGSPVPSDAERILSLLKTSMISFAILSSCVTRSLSCAHRRARSPPPRQHEKMTRIIPVHFGTSRAAKKKAFPIDTASTERSCD